MKGIELIAAHLFPEEIVQHFSITDVSSDSGRVRIKLEEKNEPPSSGLESKGFYPEKDISDFPLRGHAVTLAVKRRRWRDKKTGKDVKREIEIVASGTQLEQQFAHFLKD